MEQLYRDLASLGRQTGAERVVLFGSRARGDARRSSDVDLAVFGPADRVRFLDGVEALSSLLEFDVVFITPETAPALLENIRKDGVTLMDKATEKRERLAEALARLEEALAEYDTAPTSVVRDGVIQRFEFCAELAWKAAREHLLDQGYTEINSPKSVMRKAYADGLITDEAGWLALLTDRNLTAHLYDEEAAQAVFDRIKDGHLPLFLDLRDRLTNGQG